MAVQQNKVSKSRRNNRRAHDSLTPANPNECPNCGELKRPHHVCPSCGHYADKEIVAQADEIDLVKTDVIEQKEKIDMVDITVSDSLMEMMMTQMRITRKKRSSIPAICAIWATSANVCLSLSGFIWPEL
mgnify:CR=1 FL=1